MCDVLLYTENTFCGKVFIIKFIMHRAKFDLFEIMEIIIEQLIYFLILITRTIGKINLKNVTTKIIFFKYQRLQMFCNIINSQ